MLSRPRTAVRCRSYPQRSDAWFRRHSDRAEDFPHGAGVYDDLSSPGSAPPPLAGVETEPIEVETAMFGTASDLRQLLDDGLSPDTATAYAGRLSLLMLALPDTDKVRLLLDRGAQLNAQSASGYSALRSPRSTANQGSKPGRKTKGSVAWRLEGEKYAGPGTPKPGSRGRVEWCGREDSNLSRGCPRQPLELVNLLCRSRPTGILLTNVRQARAAANASDDFIRTHSHTAQASDSRHQDVLDAAAEFSLLSHLSTSRKQRRAHAGAPTKFIWCCVDGRGHLSCSNRSGISVQERRPTCRSRVISVRPRLGGATA